MDHSVTSDSNHSDLSQNLLTPSMTFEPFIPFSPHDVPNILNLLGTLGEITHLSLKNKTKRSESLLENSKSQSQTERTIFDQSILKALEKFRQSPSFQNRKPGIYSTIIRAKNSNTR